MAVVHESAPSVVKHSTRDRRRDKPLGSPAFFLSIDTQVPVPYSEQMRTMLFYIGVTLAVLASLAFCVAQDKAPPKTNLGDQLSKTEILAETHIVSLQFPFEDIGFWESQLGTEIWPDLYLVRVDVLALNPKTKEVLVRFTLHSSSLIKMLKENGDDILKRLREQKKPAIRQEIKKSDIRALG